VAAIDIENANTDDEAFDASKEMWRQLYPDENFDLDKNDTNRMFDIQCLWCNGTNIMDSSTFIKFRIDGMAIECAGCGSQCSLETLSSKRFWEGIEAYRTDSSLLLAGSLLSPWTGAPDPIAAQREHHHLFFHPRIQFGMDQASAASLNCSWPKVVQAFQDLGPDQYFGIRPTTLARIISSYMGLIEDRLSMDLVAGALRQRDFQKAMMVTGGQAWCQPQVLQRSLDRYQRFLLLSRAEDKPGSDGGDVNGGTANGVKHKTKNKSSRTSKETGKNDGILYGGINNNNSSHNGRQALVPTLDIDLAWHTHMLSPAHYRQFQLTYYGRVLNHDDTVQATSSMTKQDFLRTAQLWQELYHERYSSQQWEQSRFVWTPNKICASVCFPPVGVYYMYRSWSSKRAIKKSLQETSTSSKEKSKDKQKQKQKKKDHPSSSLSSSSPSSPPPPQPLSDQADQGAGTLLQQPNTIPALEAAVAVVSSSDINEKQAHNLELVHQGSLEIEDLAISENNFEKKKGTNDITRIDTGLEEKNLHRDSKRQDNHSFNLVGDGQQSPQSNNMVPVWSPPRPAVGLDGRVSHWNGETIGPDGQASCSSGACIMSPWNEVQDLAPYIDFQQQQQRELRNQRT
ncbi:hypothetical protein BGZ94_004930, partial [Podila epigama]